MQPNPTMIARLLTLPALALLLSACAVPLKPLPPAVTAPPVIPPLPLQARQPPAPVWCLPTCSAALTTDRASWLRRLTAPAPPGLRASGPMTPSTE